MKNIKLLFLIASFFLFAGVVSADNTFIFSTDPQSIPVGQVSGKINVEASSPVTETTYLNFTSSSPTGQFLNGSGNPLTSAYISTGDSNRAVYYEDSTAGDFTISVDILHKDKTEITSISQDIFIGQPVSGDDSNDNSTTTENATTTNTTTNSNDDSEAVTGNSAPSSSAHSSPEPLSDTGQESSFEISAGRDRLTSVGNSLDFKASPTETPNTSSGTITYVWSFGDGTTATGSEVSHTYRFAGNYSVVCNASFSDNAAVSRLSVKVIDPKISMSRVSGGIQIENNSGAEINLEGWMLQGQNKTFIFPKDTLISNGNKIVFADVVTGILTGAVLQNPIGTKYAEISDNFGSVFSVSSVTTTQISTDSLTSEIQNISEKVADLKSEMNTVAISNSKQGYSTTSLIGGTMVVSAPEKSTADTNQPENAKPNQQNQTANAVTVFQAPKSRGFFGTILSWPVSGFNFVLGLFGRK